MNNHCCMTSDATTKYVIFTLSRFPNLGHEQNNRPIWTFFLIHQCNLCKTIYSFVDKAHLYGDFLRCNLWKDSLWILFSSVTYIYLALLYVLSLNYTIYVNKNRTDFTKSIKLYGAKNVLDSFFFYSVHSVLFIW